MDNRDSPHNRYNLYFIFEEDKQANLLPTDKAEYIRENIFRNFAGNPKLFHSTDPPG